MRIIQLTAYVIQLPLRRQIRHASATRNESENILVCCRLQDGTEGWGEGVPRDYVTGETPAGAIEQLAATPLGEQLSISCTNWPEVIDMCDAFQPYTLHPNPRGCGSNALRCAVELAVLDAYGNVFGEPVSQLVKYCDSIQPVIETRSQVRYSTTITAETAAKERMSAIKMRIYGFRQCKVKVGVAGADDVARVRRIRYWLGPKVDIRLDANEAWPLQKVPEIVATLQRFQISCIEQPVAHSQLESLAKVKPDIALPIMLDESLTSLIDAERALQLGVCDMFNIRLSKCGGFLNSLRLAAFAHRNGIGYQLGCHPGETGILSAAGRHWATCVRDIKYLEGSYDRHLLRELPTHEDVTFGYGGFAPALLKPGLGVSIDPRILDRIKTSVHCWNLEA